MLYDAADRVSGGEVVPSWNLPIPFSSGSTPIGLKHALSFCGRTDLYPISALASDLTLVRYAYKCYNAKAGAVRHQQ